MAASNFIYSGNIETRKEYLKQLFETQNFNTENNPDFLLIVKEETKKSIGIAEIKKTIKWTQEKPFNQNKKVLVIEEANFLTTEAQNALLKTLEEPPSFLHIYLLAQNKKDVLETILSRCKRFRLGDKQETTSTELANFLKKNKGEQLSWALEAGKEDREELIEQLQNWEKEGRALLIQSRNSAVSKILVEIQKVRRDLIQTNVNQKLAIENFVMQI